ncbi:FumA C-terminus/TtdB family hydratase beta subunit [Christensenellaceae bacterium OttesenSCG-928-K19]|nr:FumA C-terminus/TtdB family hydratase beta subunit [Christensenellaceae bacterium OttesenSCG-928-K19]
MNKLQLPLTREQTASLKAGDSVLLTGAIYTARDAAHKRLVDMIMQGESLPISLKDTAIYYAGPCPSKPGQVMNSCGPTSAVRMDAYAPILFDKGVSCTIAKGPVSDEVRQAIVRNGAVYLCAAGGAGALISKCIKAAQTVAFDDLGTESIKRLEVEEMPLIVGIDSRGNSLFDHGSA